MRTVSFFDLETDTTEEICDIGCVRWDDAVFHENSVTRFLHFIQPSEFIAGHNIINHDLKFIRKQQETVDFGHNAIDTLFLSPLLFSSRPYHKLLKDDKLLTDELNNPVNDSMKARDLFFDEVHAFELLADDFKSILYNLLFAQPGFAPFFPFLGYRNSLEKKELIRMIENYFEVKICASANLDGLITLASVSLAYSLALIQATG